MYDVDIIIPTYKPDDRFLESLRRLSKQSVKPNNIYIINTDRAIWDGLDMDNKIKNLSLDVGIDISHIDKKDFDHGASRNLGVSKSKAKYFVCMTQDALPKDKVLIEELISPMSDEIKLSYARQEAYKEASEIEKFTRSYNYPQVSAVKSEADKDIYGIKLYFCSNVCAAYERETFEKLGRFKEGLILNEDMIYAACVLKSGKKLMYSAAAVVYHSHDYSARQQFERNFDIAVSQLMYKEYFEGLKSESEGIKLVKKTALHLIKKGKLLSVFKLVYISGAKYLGYKKGKNYPKLTKEQRIKCSMNKSYWERDEYAG